MTTTELSPEHKKWVLEIERDYELPVGYADALVRRYLEDPGFFHRDNLEKLRKQGAPKMEVVPMSMDVVSGARAKVLSQQIEEEQKQRTAELIPLEEGKQEECHTSIILKQAESPMSPSKRPQIELIQPTSSTNEKQIQSSDHQTQLPPTTSSSPAESSDFC